DVEDGHFSYPRKVPDYEEAFRDYGIDVFRLGPQEAAGRMQATSIPVELAAALDDWAMVRRAMREDDTGWKDLLALARAVDADDWRNRVRDALARGDLHLFPQMVASERTDGLPPATLLLLAGALWQAGAEEQAAALLRQAQQQHPGDFWINHELAYGLGLLNPPRWEDAIRFCTAAVALRPRSAGAYLNLGWVLHEKGALDEAVAA